MNGPHAGSNGTTLPFVSSRGQALTARSTRADGHSRRWNRLQAEAASASQPCSHAIGADFFRWNHKREPPERFPLTPAQLFLLAAVHAQAVPPRCPALAPL